MRVLSLIHEEDTPTGVFADSIAAAGATLEEASLALDRPPSRSAHDYDAVIVMGGGMHVDQEEQHPWLRDEKALIGDLVRRERPLLGVCLGSQLLAEAGGADVRPMPGGPEIGWFDVELTPAAADDPVVGGLPSPLLAFEWHSYGSADAPGATELARNGACVQAFRLDGAPAWGIQFHAEVTAGIVDGWIASAAGAGARASGLDTGRLSERTRQEIDRWNAVGRALSSAFIRQAARR